MDKSAYRLLKTISKHPKRSYAIRSREEKLLAYLEKEKYIEEKASTNLNQFGEPTEKTTYCYDVTLSGKAFIEDRKAKTFDIWFTRALAIAAFIISAIALLSQLGLLKLPKYL